jgi:CheY-like chemotaxis protein
MEDTEMNILYVEDDPRLRRHVLHDLLKVSHDVVEACDGTQACWLLNYHKSDLDILITDINLGGELDGWTVAEHARMISKNIGVIYATGTSLDHPLLQNSIALTKPFSSQALANAITMISASNDRSAGEALNP